MSQGCTRLETYYSAGLAHDAATLNLSFFLTIGTVIFFSVWNGGALTRGAGG